MAPTAEEYNEDELNPPEWLNAEFFAMVLRNSTQNEGVVQVKSFKICPAVVKGDHYASALFRGTVEYQLDGVDKTKSMIIKTLPEMEGIKRQFLEKYEVFEVEIGVYTEVLPRFEKYLRDLGDDTKLMARVLYHSLSPHKLLVFEDLLPQGYSVLRGRFPNAEEVKATYAKLAKWHAISLKLLREEPQIFDKYRHSLFSRDNIRQNPFTGNSIPFFMELMRNTPELREYLPHFEKLVEKVDLLDEVIASYKEYRIAPRDDAWYVLNHGDFHIKNTMFKHNSDTGKVEDVMLVDFQFSHVGPISTDLIYSIFMLVDNKLRPQISEFLQYYFDIFKDTLEKIGFGGPLPAASQLREQLLRHRFTEIFLMATFLPMWAKSCRGELLHDQMFGNREYRQKLYEDKEYIDELLVLLPKYLKEGYLEV